MEKSDEQIIRRVQSGDRAAYVALFDRYYPSVYRLARWLMRDPESACDVASETFARAFRAVDAFRVDDATPYLAYLLQIARRLAIRERSHVQRRSFWSLDDPDAPGLHLADSRRSPLDDLLAEEQRGIVGEALARLSEDDREIILLAFEKDLSRRDIAVIMGKPSVTSVTSHLHRAMTKLRAVVQEQGYLGPCGAAVE